MMGATAQIEDVVGLRVCETERSVNAGGKFSYSKVLIIYIKDAHPICLTLYSFGDREIDVVVEEQT